MWTESHSDVPSFSRVPLVSFVRVGSRRGTVRVAPDLRFSSLGRVRVVTSLWSPTRGRPSRLSSVGTRPLVPTPEPRGRVSLWDSSREVVRRRPGRVCAEDGFSVVSAVQSKWNTSTNSGCSSPSARVTEGPEGYAPGRRRTSPEPPCTSPPRISRVSPLLS